MGFALGAFALVEIVSRASGFGRGIEGELDEGLAGGPVGGVSSLDAALFAALDE